MLNEGREREERVKKEGEGGEREGMRQRREGTGIG